MNDDEYFNWLKAYVEDFEKEDQDLTDDDETEAEENGDEE